MTVVNTAECLYSYFVFGSRLGGVVVNVLATGPKGCGFEPGQDDGFLRAIKSCRKPHFRMESKAEGPIS
jgi:hypothetical protein